MKCIYCALTVEEAVVFEAASAEQSVEGVQALLALHGASVRTVDVRTVDVRRAFRRQSAGQLLLSQLLVPANTNAHTRDQIYLSQMNAVRQTRITELSG